jgi:predicted GNAT family N-acyltransferase
VLSKLPNPADELEQHAYISNVYVTPSARGGVGTRLLRTALDWARSNRIDRVVLWPTARSRTMYERHGFRASGEVLELISS